MPCIGRLGSFKHKTGSRTPRCAQHEVLSTPPGKPCPRNRELFDSLDKVESILSKSRYVAGNQLTEADVRLFMTLIRFDEVGQGG
jgi:Glutathione S-transferase, C-terminal domain